MKVHHVIFDIYQYQMTLSEKVQVVMFVLVEISKVYRRYRIGSEHCLAVSQNVRGLPFIDVQFVLFTVT